jgi:hypothetical protein
MDEQAFEDIKRSFKDKSTVEAKYWAATQTNSELGHAVMRWALAREHDEREAQAKEQSRLAEESLAAAKLAAEVSRDSAIASRRSAFWTMLAAIAAAVSAAVPLLQAAGVLPK